MSVETSQLLVFGASSITVLNLSVSIFSSTGEWKKVRQKLNIESLHNSLKLQRYEISPEHKEDEKGNLPNRVKLEELTREKENRSPR